MIDEKSSKILLVLLQFSFFVNCLQIERPNVRESSSLTAAKSDPQNLIATEDRSRSQYGYGYGAYPGYGYGGYGGNGYYDRYPGYYTTQRSLLDLIFPRTPSYYNRYYGYPPYYTTVGFPFNLFTTTPPPPFPFNLFVTNPPFLGIGKK